MKTKLAKMTKDGLSTLIGAALAAAVPAAEMIILGTTSKETLAAAGLIGIAGWWHNRGNKTPVTKVAVLERHS